MFLEAVLDSANEVNPGVVLCKKSYTGQALARVLPANGHPHGNGHPVNGK